MIYGTITSNTLLAIDSKTAPNVVSLPNRMTPQRQLFEGQYEGTFAAAKKNMSQHEVITRLLNCTSSADELIRSDGRATANPSSAAPQAEDARASMDGKSGKASEHPEEADEEEEEESEEEEEDGEIDEEEEHDDDNKTEVKENVAEAKTVAKQVGPVPGMADYVSIASGASSVCSKRMAKAALAEKAILLFYVVLLYDTASNDQPLFLGNAIECVSKRVRRL